jgi:uncharacterized delta-60 repeat protein
MLSALCRPANAWFLGLLLAGCSSGGGDVVLPIDVPAAEPDALVQLSPPRVTLPGRLEFLVEARGGLDHVDGLLPVDFRVQESDTLLDNASADLRLLPVEQFLRDSYVLMLDASSETLADNSKRSAQAQWAQESVAAILARPAAELCLVRMGPAGIETWPTPGSPVWTGVSAEASLALTALLAAPALGAGLELGQALEQGEDLVLERMGAPDTQLPARTGRGTLLLIAGQESAGALPEPGSGLPPGPSNFPRRLGLALGSFDLLNNAGAISAGVALWNGSLPAQQAANFEAYVERRLDSAYRVAYLTGAAGATEVMVGTLSLVEAKEPIVTAFEFSTAGMGAGAGHLDPWPTGASSTGIAEQSHRGAAVDGLGRLWLISDLNTAGFSVTRYLSDGSRDQSFGVNGRLIFIPSAPVTQWRAADILASGSNGQALVLTQRTAPGQLGGNSNRGVVLRIDSLGVLAERELPTATAPDKPDFVQAMRLDGTGRLWICGSSDGSAVFSQRRALWRLNADLSVDTTLDGDGAVNHKVMPGLTLTESALDLVLVSVGGQTRAILGGSAPSMAPGGPVPEATLVAFNEDGTVAFDFGANGVIQPKGLFHQTSRAAVFTALELDPQGRLVAAGSIQVPWDSLQAVPCLWRCDPQGVPDGAFGLGTDNLFAPGQPGNGVGIWAPASSLAQPPAGVLFGNSLFSDLAISPEGAPIAVGWRSNTLQHLDALWMRLTPAGVLDTEFNGQGFLIADGGLVLAASELPRRLLRLDSGALASVGAVSTVAGTGAQLLPLVMVDTDPLRAY